LATFAKSIDVKARTPRGVGSPAGFSLSEHAANASAAAALKTRSAAQVGRIVIPLPSPSEAL
jgi:hypothetical protein